MKTDNTFEKISKRERLQILRERAKLEKNLGSIADLTRLPSALFIVDILKEKIAVAEAKKLNIPTFAIVDTNSNPNQVDFAIPANDDASKSISLIVGYMVNAIEEGLAERKLIKDKEKEDEREEEITVEAATLKALEGIEDEDGTIVGKKVAKKETAKMKGFEEESEEAIKNRKAAEKAPKKVIGARKTITKK
jgi:small subunit ribosomal protein S2